MEKQVIHQHYLVELKLYKGFKLKLGNNVYETYLKKDFYTYGIGEVCFIKDNQKTLSSIKITQVTMISCYPKDEAGHLNVGDNYYVLDLEENEYIACGKVLEVVKQE